MAAKISATDLDELRFALANLLDATLGLDAPHIARARETASAILDRTAGFDVEDWRVLCSYVSPSGNNANRLPSELRKAILRKIWTIQDGYGFAGATPVQGWDWSGIRDSSREAKAAMIAAAREIAPGIF